MVFYPIQTLVNAGITEVLIVIGGPHAGHFMRVLKNGTELGLKSLSFAYQETGNGGIADALALAEDFADGDDITVILGDNTTDTDISEAVKNFDSGATLFLKRVPDPERYGVPEFHKKNPKKIVGIEEKPAKPKSDYAVTGLYIYDKKCFDYIKTLKPSARGQLEVTDLNNIYIKAGKMQWDHLHGFWTDAGKPETLYLSNMYWAAKKGL